MTRIRSAATEYWFELLIAVMAVSGMLELVVGRDSPGAPATSLCSQYLRWPSSSCRSSCVGVDVLEVAKGGSRSALPPAAGTAPATRITAVTARVRLPVEVGLPRTPRFQMQPTENEITHIKVLEIETPRGPARAHLHPTEAPRAALILGHGAGGGVDAPDLVAATEAAQAEAISVVLVEQPYRVAGRRSSPGPAQLDEAWIAVVEALRTDELSELQLIVGGRSLGARVACRTVEATGAVAVLCLAFPLEPPRRAGKPPQSRLPELDAVTLPTLVVQGERDPFGMPPPGPSREVVMVPGDHGLKRDAGAVAAAVRVWLAEVIAGPLST